MLLLATFGMYRLPQYYCPITLILLPLYATVWTCLPLCQCANRSAHLPSGTGRRVTSPGAALLALESLAHAVLALHQVGECTFGVLIHMRLCLAPGSDAGRLLERLGPVNLIL